MEKIRGKVHFKYDGEVDVLYSYINKPRKARCVDVADGVLLRIDPNTNKVVGFTIIDYQRRRNDGLLEKIPCFDNIKLPNYKLAI